MTTRRVVIDTDRKRGHLFKIEESNGRYYVYRVEVGLMSNTSRKVGEARQLSDALEIAKTSLSGPVRNIKVGEW
jgi:hypothetical protein